CRQAKLRGGTDRFESPLSYFETEGDDFHRNWCTHTQPIHELQSIHDNCEAPARGGNDLLVQQCAAESLMRFSVSRSTSSAPSMVRSISRCSRNDVSGMFAAFAWAAVRSEVGMPMNCNPSRWRRPSASIAKVAVEPVPSPTTMPSCTSSTA